MLKKISFLLLALAFQSFPQSDIKILRSDANALTVEFTPVYTDTSVHLIDGRNYRAVQFSGSVRNPSAEVGSPDARSKKITLGIPFENGLTVEVLSESYTSISGELVPVPEVKPGEKGDVEYFYNKKNFKKIETEPIFLGENGNVRGLVVQDVFLNTVVPDGGKIKLLTKMVVKFSFANKSNRTPIEDELLQNFVLNYDMAKYWIERKPAGLHKGSDIGSTVLSSGKWFRFEAPEEGFYRIKYDQLSNYGINPATVNPKTIKIYNNGGYVLSENINDPRPDDLQELAIIVKGEEDGRFDANDEIIFYGRGVSFWYYDNTAKRMKRNQHPYSEHNYYWITSDGAPGKRIGTKPSVQEGTNNILETTHAYDFVDDDKINLGETGRYFVGDEFSQNTKSRVYQKKVEGIVPGTPTYYSYWFVNRSIESIPLTVEENGKLVRQSTISGIGSDVYTIGRLDSVTGRVFNGNYPDERSVLRFTFATNSNTSYGYLDFYEISWTRYLKAFNDKILFYSPKIQGTTAIDSLYEYHLSNFSNTNIKVYDITNHSDVREITDPALQSGSELRFRAWEGPGRISRYYAFCGDQYMTPENPTEMPNQNVRGDLTGADLILITAPELMETAKRYKQYRESKESDAISVKIVTVGDIMNEFNCGTLDPTAIRDFIKYAFSNWQIAPKYVLIWGDGDYDYKNIEGKNKNFVPTFQSKEFLNDIYSFSTDDYYVWIVGNDKRIDLGLGRIAAQSNKQAGDYLDKVIAYENSTDRSPWKNLITLVADDHLTSQGIDLAGNTQQSERLSQTRIPPQYVQKKIYLINYPTVQTSLGRRKPEVNTAIIDAINDGTVLLNYIGHGSPDLWAHEQVFVRGTTIPQLKNSRYFFLTAATCDFGYYDRTEDQSATEDLLFLPNAGAIGVYTAVRPVFSEQNTILNDSLYHQMLKWGRDHDNLPKRIGTAYFLTKVNFQTDNDQKFQLFADPALRPALPQYTGTIDSINGINPAVSVIPIKALNSLRIAGSVKRADGTDWTDFNGEGLLTVFDAETTLPLPEISTTASMKVPGGLIFRGRVSVINGKFSADFVVPKDISYDNQKGKIIFYFFDSKEDGVSFTNNISIGGVDQTVVNDGKGPVIEITFDNAEYSNTYLVNPDATLIVSLKDETGLNTTGIGVGHKLEAILNGNDLNPIDLTNHFTGDLNSGGKSGKADYKFNNLAPGLYNIKVKGWDVFNNSSTVESEFKVVSERGIAVEYVMNYPNPFSANTFFTFQHNVQEPIDVRILIYTVAGRKINEIESNWVSERFVRLEWDGRDSDGDLVANGTYLYKLIVKPSAGGETKTVYGKLTIIR